MSTTETSDSDDSSDSSDGISELLLPRRIERKLTSRGSSSTTNHDSSQVTNRDSDSWHEYDGEPLFDDSALNRLAVRFSEMKAHDYEKLFTVKGSTGPRTKIRTKDLQAFREAVRRAEQAWIAEHGKPLTRFGNTMYGDDVGEYGTIEVVEENARKTVVSAQYATGYKAFMGGADGKRQKIILPVRDYEQWAYHKEVVEPLFEQFHEKYPY